MIDQAALLSSLAIGFFGSAHCFVMCGGIASALSFAIPLPQQKWRIFTYHLLFGLGRISSYAVAGALVSTVSSTLGGMIGNNAVIIFRSFSGIMLILMGLYVANWWRVLVHLERVAAGLWKIISPTINYFKPVNTLWKAYCIGLIWGWLPCGLVYSVLLWSAAAEHVLNGALIMLCFGLGTLPAVLATGSVAAGFQTFFQRPGYRKLAGLLICLFGLWTLLGPHLLPAHHHGM